MQSNAARAGLLIGLTALAVGLFVVLSGGDDHGTDGGPATGPASETAPPEPAVQTIEMRYGVPVGGVRRLTYTRGDTIRIVVRLDERQEDIHIHGYDEQVVAPTKLAEFDFPARLEGIFELEAHGPDGDVVLAEIVVNPG